MPRLELALLGPFQATIDGRPITEFESNKVRALLAYLAVESDRPHARESLAGLLWPGYPDRSALNNLRSALANLRRAINDHDAEPPLLLISREAIQFNSAADCALDVTALCGAARQQPEQLAQAVEGYHGPFLDGFSLDDCPAFEEWALARRAALLQEALAALTRLAADAEAQGDTDRALAYARRGLSLEPWDEQAHRQVMRALALSGRRDQALAQYETCRQALEQELGVEPAAETQALAGRIRDESLGAPATAALVDQPPAPGPPPFKGLRFFDEADAALFFGRGALTAHLADQVRAFLDPYFDGARVLTVIGASGSGKSSIVRAGLLPALRPDFGAAVFVLTPTARPLEALALALTKHSEGVGATAILLDDLARDPRCLHLAAARLAREHSLAHILLVVDQFEELFSLCRDETERAAFIDALLYAVETPGPACLVLALRADFYAQCAPYPALRDALCCRQQYIGAMSPEELRLAIEEPAHGGGWILEPGLVDLYLSEVGDAPGALPLLSHALLETWRRRRGRTMTLAGYQEAGGVSGAIAHTAESTYKQLAPEQQGVARGIFLRLTELGSDMENGETPERFTRRRVALSEFTADPDSGEKARQVLARLADARLVTTSQETAEITHEALLREWARLGEWLEEDLAGLRLHRRLTEAAQEWAHLDQEPGLLYRGALLATALEAAAGHDADLNQQERDFLEASRAAEQAQQEAEEAARQRELAAAQALAEEQRLRAETEVETAGKLRRRALSLGLAAAALVVLLGAALWLGQTANANALAREEQARLATSRELAAAAVNSLQIDPERGVLLALQALDMADTLEARNALHQALPELHNERTIAAHGPGGAPGVSYSPDGAWIASIGVDGTAKVWEAATGNLLQTLSGEPDIFGFDIAFSPDGDLLAASWASQVLVWEMPGGGLRWRLPGQMSGVGSGDRLSFSPDSARLAVANMEGRPTVWDMADGRELFTLSGHEGVTDGLAYSPDGKRLATGDSAGIVKIWDAATGQEVSTLEHGGWVHALAFSPNGKHLAAGGEDGRLVVWDIENGGTLLSLPTRSGLYDVVYMPDGERLVSVHQEGLTMVWDAATGQELLALAGHLSTVISVSPNPDNVHIATSGYDSTVRIWDTRPGREVSTILAHHAPAYGLALSPDGTRLASAGADGAATLWDAASGLPLLSLFTDAGSDGWESIVFSPDGRRLAAGRVDGALIVGDVQTGQIDLTLEGHKDLVWGLAFSPDGTRLASTSWDRTVRLWDLQTGHEITTMTGHTDMIFGVAFNQDGTRLYSGGDRNVREWDASTGVELRKFSGEDRDIYGVALSPDGERLVMSRQDGSVTTWDIETGERLQQFTGHGALVVQLVFSRDGTRLATASFDKYAKVWDVASGQEIATLYGNGGNVFGVAFSPDGRFAYTAGGDGTLRTYTLDTAELTALARSRLTRDLSAEECRRYLHLEQCPVPQIATSH